MPPNCINDQSKECIGYAHAKILEHKIDELVRKQEEYQERNRKDHKEFYERLEAGDRAQAVTQNQLAEILSDTNEIKRDLKEKAKELTDAITDLRMKPARKWDNLSDKILSILLSVIIGAALAAVGLGAFAP